VLTIEELNKGTQAVEKLYGDMQLSLLKIIADTIKTQIADGEEINITLWQVDKLNQMNILNRKAAREIGKVVDVSEKVISEAIEKNGLKVLEDTDSYIDTTGEILTPRLPTIDIINEMARNTFVEIDNFVNQTLITTNFGEGAVSLMYRDIIQESAALHTSGVLTLDKAISRTMMKWVDAGVPSAFIDKGGNRWSMKRYIKTVLRSTNARVYNELRTARMAEFGLTTVLMSSKLAARPACAPIQGKVLDITEERINPEYPNVYDYGYGTPGGTRGINCGHMWFPFDPELNINEQMQFDEEDALKQYEINQTRNRLRARIENTEEKLAIAGRLKDMDEMVRLRNLHNRQTAALRLYNKHIKAEEQRIVDKYYAHR
jgi:hypothetical protein